MSRSPDRLLSTFRIVQETQQARAYLLSCSRSRQRGPQAGLATHKHSVLGRRYNEKDLEEWIARNPGAIFPRSPVLLLASEKYGRLDSRASADLLFLDQRLHFSIVETKVLPIARNRGISFTNLHRQMQQYVSRLRDVFPGFPRSLWNHYHSFSTNFYGYRRNLTMRMAEVFGPKIPREAWQRPPLIWQVYVAGEFDDQALFHFRQYAKENHGGIRLIYYRYYPQSNYIEFWEIPG